MATEDKKELFAALAKAMTEIKPPTKSSTNPHFKSKYAALGDVLDAVTGPLVKNGILLLQPLSEAVKDNEVILETLLVHLATGQSWSHSCSLPFKPNGGPQDAGSAITYLRRYSLMTLFCLDAEDDDGNQAQGRPPGPVNQDPMMNRPAPSEQRSNLANKLTKSLGGTFK